MTRRFSGAPRLSLTITLAILASGCGEESADNPGVKPGPGGPGQGPAVASNPKLKAIMTKVGKGPQALQGSLGDALKQAEPAWEPIQAKAKEYAQLASETGQHDPVKGSKDSWQKLASAFSASAADLDKAAQSKDKANTQTALETLGNSCMSCHRQHRVMGPPGGGPGPGGPGGPPGGPGGPGGAQAR